MKKFITFEEKVLSKISLSDYIIYLNKRAVTGLEIAMHEKLLDFNTYKELATKTKDTPIKLNYHIPDFVTEGQYEIADINLDFSIKKNFTSFYDNILRLIDHAGLTPETTITFHGAKAYDGNYQKAFDATMFFSDFSLNLFEKHALPFKLSCETLNSSIMTFGDSRIDLLRLVTQFESDSLGICWDIVHDRNNFEKEYTMPDDLFYKYINNVHLHGSRKVLSTVEDHLPLHKSDLELATYMDYLKSHHYGHAITHELLDFRCSNYILDLERDLDILDEYF